MIEPAQLRRNQAPALGADAIEERLREAAWVMRRLPRTGTAPAQLKAVWPDVVHSVAEAYNRTPEPVRPPTLEPEQILLAEEAVQWLFWLERDERRIVWARANNLSWRKIERADPRERTERTLRKVLNEALEEIATHLRHGTKIFISGNSGK